MKKISVLMVISTLFVALNSSTVHLTAGIAINVPSPVKVTLIKPPKDYTGWGWRMGAALTGSVLLGFLALFGTHGAIKLYARIFNTEFDQKKTPDRAAKAGMYTCLGTLGAVMCYALFSWAKSFR